MTIAIVIGTHGWAAEQLLKTAEMLLGEQENVGWIDFVPGENAETLIEKYNAQLAKLDTTKGVLFLVDTWGGSPFNASSPAYYNPSMTSGESPVARDMEETSSPISLRFRATSSFPFSIPFSIPSTRPFSRPSARPF